MRGKVRETLHIINNYRITPAYAGKSSVADKTFTPQRDHPRLCGEKTEVGASTMETMGSPPPMRGKDMNKSKIDSSIRITPAYAGKSETGRFHSLQV